MDPAVYQRAHNIINTITIEKNRFRKNLFGSTKSIPQH